MGRPARRHTDPITRCWDQPHYRFVGTDDGRGIAQTLDKKRLTLIRVPCLGGVLNEDHYAA
jgi:hypothetical protein